MTITPEQRQFRKKKIGASDVAAIYGLDHYRSPYDVYAEKVFELEPVETDAMRIGNFLEPVVLNIFEHEHDVSLKRDSPTAVAAENPLFVAHLDGLDEGIGMPVEAKSVSRYARDLQEWGHEGDAVPFKVILQTQMQMFCFSPNSQLAYAAALVMGEYRDFAIPRDQSVIDAAVEYCSKWWRDYVVANKRPPGTPDIRIVKAIRRIEGASTRVHKGLITRWRKAQESARKIKSKEEGLYAEILAELGDAEVGEYRGGRVTYFENERHYKAQPAREARTIKSRTLRVQ